MLYSEEENALKKSIEERALDRRKKLEEQKMRRRKRATRRARRPMLH